MQRTTYNRCEIVITLTLGKIPDMNLFFIFQMTNQVKLMSEEIGSKKEAMAVLSKRGKTLLSLLKK